MLVGPFGQKKKNYKGYNVKKYTLIFLLVLSVMVDLYSEMPFTVVMYDDKTEKVIGDFPPNRIVWSNTIDKLKEYGAKAIVLKFFYDLPKDDDAYLSKSIKTIPTFLQACINNNEPTSNKLDNKFSIKLDKKYNSLISGSNGWIPMNYFADNAYDIGFVDVRDINEIPIIENYNGMYVKSLYFCILQYIFPSLRIENNVLITNNKKIKLNKYSEMSVTYPKEDKLDYISLTEVLNGKADKKLIENKIMIICWDGSKSESFNISTGLVKTHRVFIYGLYDMYNQLK